MKLIEQLKTIWANVDSPFLISSTKRLRFSDFELQPHIDLSSIVPGEVVALIGDFDPQSILILLRLIDLRTIILPLTKETANQHEYFFNAALVDVVIENGVITRRQHCNKNKLLETLKKVGHAGLVLFSTGTTGSPKAILHDLTRFLKRYETPRPPLRMLSFLLFDHIGGLNTLFHILFNRGVIVTPQARTVNSILKTCQNYAVEVLPTSPTFLRMMLMSGAVPDEVPETLKIITYGTECMDQTTLNELCRLLPRIDFRQTFGLSELGIVRVKSEARNSLFMKIGGEGVETKIVNGILQIRSASKMLGYLNAPSPFDHEGWYNTKDMVEQKEDYIKIIGRVSDVINVGGLKFMASDIENIALEYPGIELVQAFPRRNPITGQHVELIAQPVANAKINKDKFMAYLESKLQSYMLPKRIRIAPVAVGHRFKRG